MKLNFLIKEITDWIICIVIAVVLALFFRHFIGTPTVVLHESMYPTLEQYERLWINRWAKTTHEDLQYGDIVTFEQPVYDLTTYIKDQDKDNPVAKYNEYEGFEKFKHDFLEIGKTSYIKRVIGLPGDKIEIKNDKVYRNGKEIDEWYLNAGTVTTVRGGVYNEITVPEGTFFALGDNRANSIDSRYFGCIPIDKLESKVVGRIWPLNKFGAIDKEQ